MNILIIDVQKKPAVTSKGNPYEQLLVVYKSLPEGKVAQKTLVPFGEGQTVFKTLEKASKDDYYEVEVVKNGQFTEWSSIHRQDNPPKQETPDKVPTMIAKPTYETPAERAERQRLIVRQSSLSNAITTLSVGSKHLDFNEVLSLAETYCKWVENNPKEPVTGTGFDDMKSDL